MISRFSPKVWALLAASSTLATPAFAQGSAKGNDQAVAQALFDQARALMAKKDYTHACVLLEKSEALDPGGGTLLNLAGCYEGQGALAHAYATYQEALSQAHRENRNDRATTAAGRIEAIAPKLPHILIDLPQFAGDPTLVVQLDDTLMGSSVVGVPTPVDPGPHHVRVSLMNRKPWSWDGSAEIGQTTTLSPVLVLLDALPPPVATTPPAPIAAPAQTAAPPPRDHSKPAVASYVLGGVAVGALATAVATGVVALNAQSDWKSQCIPDRSYCTDPAAAESDATRGRTMAWVSTISLGVSAAAFL
ncbi:MAG: tetratricopeptide repeat protein, partial [Polyangiaceae bacterium]